MAPGVGGMERHLGTASNQVVANTLVDRLCKPVTYREMAIQSLVACSYDEGIMERFQELWTGFGVIAVGIVIVVLAIKLLWNFASAYVMMRRALKQPADQPVAMSFHPMLDVALLVSAILISLVTIQNGIFRPVSLSVYGAAAIVTSYLHLFVVGMLFGSVRSLLSKWK